MTTPGQPGWYDDPQSSDALRYWDGHEWTGRLKPKLSQSASPPPVQSTRLPVPDTPLPPLVRRSGPSGGMTPVAVGGIALLLVCLAVFFGFKLFGAKPEHNQVAGSSGGSASHGGADEDQIKNLVQTFTDDFNNHDLAGMQSLMCTGARLPRDVFQLRDRVGPFTNQVSNIVVTGDTATAVVRSTWSGPGGTGGEQFDNSYAKENGDWRICHTVNF